MKASNTSAAAQCHELGIIVGDKIKGRETYTRSIGRAITGMITDNWTNLEWSEAELECLWIGDQIVVWRMRRRTNLQPEWRACGEAANWSLDAREWEKTS